MPLVDLGPAPTTKPTDPNLIDLGPATAEPEQFPALDLRGLVYTPTPAEEHKRASTIYRNAVQNGISITKAKWQSDIGVMIDVMEDNPTIKGDIKVSPLAEEFAGEAQLRRTEGRNLPRWDFQGLKGQAFARKHKALPPFEQVLRALPTSDLAELRAAQLMYVAAHNELYPDMPIAEGDLDKLGIAEFASKQMILDLARIAKERAFWRWFDEPLTYEKFKDMEGEMPEARFNALDAEAKQAAESGDPTKAFTPEGWEVPMEEMSDADFEAYKTILSIRVREADAKVERSLAGRFGKSLERGKDSIIRNLADLIAGPIMGKPKLVSRWKQLEAIVYGAGSLQPRNIVERGLQGAGEMAPLVAASYVSGGMGLVGKGAALTTKAAAAVSTTGFWTTQIAPGRYVEMIDAGIEHKYAAPMSIVSAVPEAVIEQLQVKQLTPAKKKGLMGAMYKSLWRYFKTFGNKTLKTYGKQMAEEATQAGIGVATKAAAAYLDENAPGVDWKEEMRGAKDELGQAALTIPFLMAPGHVVGAARGSVDVMKTKAQINATEVLAKVHGIEVEQVQETMDEARERVADPAEDRSLPEVFKEVAKEKAQEKPEAEAAPTPKAEPVAAKTEAPAAPEATTPDAALDKIASGLGEQGKYSTEHMESLRKFRSRQARGYNAAFEKVRAKGKSVEEANAAGTAAMAGVHEEATIPPESRPQLSEGEWTLLFDLAEQVYTNDVFARKQAIKLFENLRDGVVLRPHQIEALSTFADDAGKPIEAKRDARELSDPQRVKNATDALERSIAEIERRIAEKDLFPEKQPSKTPKTPELEALRTRRDALKEELKALQEIARPKPTAQEKALQAYKKRLAKRVAEIEERLASGELTPPERKTLELDAEAQALREKAADAARRVAEALRKQIPITARLTNMLLRIVPGSGAFLKSVKAADIASFAGRQLLPTLGHDISNLLISPITGKPTADWARSVWPGIVAFFDESRFNEYMDAIREARSYEALVERGIVTEMGDVEKSLREEGFYSKAAEKMPLVKRANRAAVVMRDMAVVLQGDRAMEVEEARGRELTPKRLDRIFSQIGNFTGRAKVSQDPKAQKVYNFVNEVAWSPRFALARFKNLATLYGLISRDPYVRAQGAKTLAGSIVFTALTAWIASLFGYDTDEWQIFGDDKLIFDDDALSADLLKARKGDTRYDLTGGYGSIVRFIARMATGYTKDASGRIHRIDRVPVMINFLKGKSAPLLGLLTTVFTGKDWVGRKIEGPGEWTREAVDQVGYMWLNDVIDAVADEMDRNGLIESLPAGIAPGLAGQIGMGVQTYPQSAITKTAIVEDRLAQEAHGKDWNDLGPRAQRDIVRANKELFRQAGVQKDIERKDRDSTNFEARMKRRSIEAGNSLIKKLPAAQRMAIEEVGADIQLDPRVGSGDRAWMMNEARFADYQDRVLVEIQTRIAEKMNDEEWPSWPRYKRQDKLNTAISLAKGRIERAIMREANAEDEK